MLALDEGQRLAVAPDRTDDDAAQLAEREPEVRGDDELVLDHEHLDAGKRPLRPCRGVGHHPLTPPTGDAARLARASRLPRRNVRRSGSPVSMPLDAWRPIHCRVWPARADPRLHPRFSINDEMDASR